MACDLIFKAEQKKYMESIRGGISMLLFRKMTVDDLDPIFKNEVLKPLLLVEPKGEKFGVVAEDDGRLIGGATGYIEKESAFIQKIAIENTDQEVLLWDGIVRAVAYVLDRSGIKKLIANGQQNGQILRRIGFKPVDSKDQDFGELILEDIRDGKAMELDLSAFFSSPRCSGE